MTNPVSLPGADPPEDPVEVTLSAERLAEKVLKLGVGERLKNSAWGIPQRRAQLQRLFSAEKINELTENQARLSQEVIYRIYHEIGSQRNSIFSVIDELVPRPSEARINVCGTVSPLRTLVSDPDSREAKVIAWYASEGANFDHIFELPTTSVERDALAIMQRARAIYDRLIQDTSVTGLGREGEISRTAPYTVNPLPPPALPPAPGKLLRAQEKIAADMNRRETLESSRATTSAKKLAGLESQIASLDQSIERQETSFGQLQEKRDGLRNDLESLNTLFQHTSTGIVTAPLVVDDLCVGFNTSAINTQLGLAAVPFAAAGLGGTLHDWLTKGNIRERSERMLTRSVQSGLGRLRSATVLEDLVRQEFTPEVPHLSPEQRENFLRRMRGVLTESHAHDPAAVTPSPSVPSPATSPDPIPPASSSSSSAREAAQPKKGFFAKIGAAVTGTARTVSSYMNEEGPSLLGFYTRKK